MLKPHPSKGHKLADLCVLLLCSTAVYADTVYRCGEAYSTASQCGNAAATEVKPASVLSTGPSTNTSAHELRDAQALEKQRLHAQRQAAQTAPVLINTPAPGPLAASNASVTPSRQQPHSRRPASPYFTATDPSHAKQKKKSTAKAVPAAATANP
jgi:hypothetical protein